MIQTWSFYKMFDIAWCDKYISVLCPGFPTGAENMGIVSSRVSYPPCLKEKKSSPPP